MPAYLQLNDMKSSFKNLFGKKDKQTENLQLEISGMTCNHCAAGIERMFAGKKGMIAAKVDYPSASGSFSFDPAKISKDEIIDLINQTGSYEVVGEKGDEKKKGGV
ncbi:MAG: copper chaperone [Bacteroidetes bacterium]|nr:MAG: copper chaperone [Bacteroidota bacterium]